MISNLLAPNAILRGTRAEYKIVGVIAQGGMGAVYRAQRQFDGTIWALKEMRLPENTPPKEVEENRQLFSQEGKLLESLSHPSLPVIADSFTYDDRPVLVMEFVPGQTLEQRMRDANAPLLEQQVVNYGIQIARVLYYLHTRNPKVIYRDLKPSNVMLTPDGVLKLIDFGVARTYKKSKSKDTVAMGSAGYAPPEQYGKNQTDERSDVYALGATLLHLLTNMPPIPLQTPAPGSIHKLNPSVNAKTEQVIIKAMALDPANRYPDMKAFEQALMNCLDAPYVDPVAHAPHPPPIVASTERVPATMPVPRPPVMQVQPAPVVSSQSPLPVHVPIGGTPCEKCGRINKPGARFCAGCGSPLGAPPTARLLITSPRGSWEQRIDHVPLRIGRRDPRRNHYPDLDLAEHDRGIASRNHAVITRDGDYYTLIDLNSTNGTYLNGMLVAQQQPQRLRSGDRIKVGEVEMEFRWN